MLDAKTIFFNTLYDFRRFQKKPVLFERALDPKKVRRIYEV